MIIYKDIVTGDEIISDTYKLIDVDDVVYEVNCQMVTKGAENIDIGANPSAEEQDEILEEGTERVIDVVDGFRLENMNLAFQNNKKSFLVQFKHFLKTVVAKLKEGGKSEEEIKAFQEGVQNYWKQKLVPNFANLDFYTGQSMNPEGMIVFLNYREDGITPYVIIWKHALTAMKV